MTRSTSASAAGAGVELILQFPETGGIHRGKRRTCGCQRLGIGHPARSAENPQELVALTSNPRKKPQLLKNHAPRNHGKNQQNNQNHAGHPAGLAEDVSEIGDEKRCERENDLPLSESSWMPGPRATGMR